jgi:hypothetical protein
MRFSLKWLLLGTAYVALVAASIGSGNWLLADAVWAVTLCILCYAIVTACFATERQRRSAALGFVILAVGYVVCGYMSAGRLSTKRLLSAFGYSVSADGKSLYAPRTPPETVTIGRSQQVIIPSMPCGKAIIDTVYAATVMVAGLIGAGIAAFAYRNSKQKQTE